MDVRTVIAVVLVAQVPTYTEKDLERVRRGGGRGGYSVITDPAVNPTDFLPARHDQDDQPKVMLFGGSGHKTYLGCLSCETTEFDSLFNRKGPYGACVTPVLLPTLWPDNLFCRRSASVFGAEHVSRFSACNQLATDPPVIVDRDGMYFGRFAVSSYELGHLDAVCQRAGRAWNEDLCKIVNHVCSAEE